VSKVALLLATFPFLKNKTTKNGSPGQIGQFKKGIQ
jgi:hypothetical protein